MKKLKFIGVDEIIMATPAKGLRGKAARALKRLYTAICRYNNRKQLEFICNLHPNYTGGLSSDQTKLLDKVSEYVKADPFITKNKRLVYRIPRLEDVTLWQVIEARRSETASEVVTKWCTPREGEPAEYAPDNIYHLLAATKYIREQIDSADEFESTLFPHMAGDPEASDDPIREAKNVLTLIQATAELFVCSFEEAKRVNYLDAMLALAKRHEENEKQKAEMKKHFNK